MTSNVGARALDVRQASAVEGYLSKVAAAVSTTDRPIAVHRSENDLHTPVIVERSNDVSTYLNSSLFALLPPIYPEWLGDRSFNETHGARFAYVVGEMARGITSAKMVIEAARAGFVGFFGSAGLEPPQIRTALEEIKCALGPEATGWGANLIHNPDRPDMERATVEFFLEHRVKRVSASAFMRLSHDVAHYSIAGLARDSNGRISRSTHVFAKVSRPEVARQFMSPAPSDMLRELVAAGRITSEQSELAQSAPVAEDVTVEGDSGGHTDNRPIASLFPVIANLRDDLAARHGYVRPIRLGLAGGLGAPSAIAAAFQQGAAYVMTGSINQSAIEAGVSSAARALLAQAEIADVTMAPAADMFELGVKVQVLKRGTMFATRGQKLYELYRRYDSLEALPDKERRWLETQVLRESVSDAWANCRDYLRRAHPTQMARAEHDAKLRMALVFRRYLFLGAEWARDGADDRRIDYQIWCGPAMGAFNDWVRGSALEPIGSRTVAAIGRNLLEGAAAITRAHQLRMAGVHVPAEFFSMPPKHMG
ncbi:MAG: PfaD family polyunsaturated fatty acid/polyketide biosynthesis protein [Methylocystis sp.]|uniref:PfaD family polyunsaturated fatty acid/polyketide biosynthesis protein n=1 Tax=Methylocystis sp. TaxID=1911079 RepID=UPI003DA4FD3C